MSEGLVITRDAFQGFSYGCWLGASIVDHLVLYIGQPTTWQLFPPEKASQAKNNLLFPLHVFETSPLKYHVFWEALLHIPDMDISPVIVYEDFYWTLYRSMNIKIILIIYYFLLKV